MSKSKKNTSNFLSIFVVALIVSVLSLSGCALMQKVSDVTAEKKNFPEWSISIDTMGGSAASTETLTFDLDVNGVGKPKGITEGNKFIITGGLRHARKTAEIRFEINAAKPVLGKTYTAQARGKVTSGQKVVNIVGQYRLEFTEHGDGFSSGFVIVDPFTKYPFKIEVPK